ncbi:MAG: family 16 glycoside hydrolase [Sedimentisphaerales bacterium]|jgi:sugar phosphate isomerase/epimerase
MRKMTKISVALAIWLALVCGTSEATEKITLTDLSAWRQNPEWSVVGDAFEHPRNENLLSVREGTGVIVNGRKAKSPPLVSIQEFGDARIHVEFLIPKSSNSGVYLQGQYEIQILDSWTDANVAYPGGECGGIYPRWDKTRPVKSYDGHSPLVNASRPPGQWQTFDIIFRAAMFDSEGKKIANAKIVKLWLNGTLIHKDVELTGPTRGSFKPNDLARGPLVLQGDHGHVAFRNIWVTPLDSGKMGLTNPFFAMDTGIIDESHKSAKSQVDMLKELGYAGIGYWERNPANGAAGLAEMLGELNKSNLKMFGAYFTIKLEEPAEKYTPLIEDSIRLLAGRKSTIWIAMTSEVHQKSTVSGDEQAVAIISRIADVANKNGVTVALYPHEDFWLEKIEDAVRLAEKSNRRNVGVVFNLYHWLKTDKPANMETAVAKAMPYLLVVTINGTTEAGSIETLDRGTFDVYRFLRAIKQAGFTGPVGLQGYGIGGDVRENLRRSMQAWREFSQRLAAEDAENL